MDCIKKNPKVLFLIYVFSATVAPIFSMQTEIVSMRTTALEQRALSVECLLKQDPYLIIASRNVNQRDISGQTVLHRAAKYGHAAFIKNLIICGANPTICDFNLIPPLFYAVEHKHLDCIYALTKNTKYVNIIGPGNRTALHLAALMGYAEGIALLIKKGARLNIRDEEGKTPLFYAKLCGHQTCVEILIANGAI